MRVVIPEVDVENKRLSERRRGFMQVKKNKVAQEPSSCYICNKPNNIVRCKQCSKSSCEDCRRNDMCIICDPCDDTPCLRLCIYKCFRFR